MANNELKLSFALPSLNEMLKAKGTMYGRSGSRRYSAYTAMKKKYMQAVEAELIAQNCIPEKPFKAIDIEFVWMEAGRGRDPDNVRAGGAKFILDAMVNCGIMPDDSMKYVKHLADKFQKGKERGVIVKWTEYMER
ncbi:MAG: hypothetical protein U9R15_08575 [Chloroflexota bacterium]|nr:hypothetical protein [Chloroflexota bacterium]